MLLAIVTGVTGDASAGVADYSRATHGLGANDVPPFLCRRRVRHRSRSNGSVPFRNFQCHFPQAQPQAAGLAIGGYLFVAHLIGTAG